MKEIQIVLEELLDLYKNGCLVIEDEPSPWFATQEVECSNIFVKYIYQYRTIKLEGNPDELTEFVNSINEAEFWETINNTYYIGVKTNSFGRGDAKHFKNWALLKHKYGIDLSSYKLIGELLTILDNRKRLTDINGKRFTPQDIKDKYKLDWGVVQNECLPLVKSNALKIRIDSRSSVAIIFIPKDEKPQKVSCKQCGDWIPLYYNIPVFENKPICPECFSSIVSCAECGKKIIARLQGIYNTGGRDVLCRQCYEKKRKYLIKAYHDTPELEFYEFNGATMRNSQTSSNGFKGFGVELEVGKAGQKHCHSEEVIKCLNEEVYTMRDGSINRNGVLGGADEDYGGFEIITHPHTEMALYNMNWEQAFKYLLKHGYRSHDIETCGLHLHISREFFKYDHSGIVRMMFFYDNWYPDVCRFARRKLDKAKKWANRTDNNNDYSWNNGIEDYYDYYDDWNCEESHDERYRAVNIQNYSTVEIRIMRGTLRLSTFLASLDFMITIMKNAIKMTDNDVYNLDKWLFGLKPETIEYMKQRKCFGYDIEQDYEQVEQNELEENIIIEEDNI